MEHIVQFAISIDDDAITKKVQANAEKIIVQQLQQKVEKAIFETDYYGKPKNSLNNTAESIILAWLDSHKESIIQLSAKMLADKLAKTKAAKVVLEEVLKND